MASIIEEEMGKILVPKDILEYFDIKEIKNKEEEIIITLIEKEALIPKEMLSKKQAVLDGYCNPIELQGFPAQGKAVYLILYRRRWKETGKGERNFMNEYAFQAPGTKATKEFGAFLKEAFRDRTYKL